MRQALALLLVVVLAGCASPDDGGVAASGSAEPSAQPSTRQSTEPAVDVIPAGTVLRLEVTGERPHDSTAFTQGLEFDGDRLFESRGLYGESAMTEIDPVTGEVLDQTPLGEDYFAEGATVIGDRIIQITWRELTAFVYDRETLDREGQLAYTGEGWGICDDGNRLVMSDGSATLTFRDPTTFLPLSTVQVTRDGAAVARINELECIDGMVLANVWQTNEILVIDLETGEVVSTIDASAIADSNGRHLEDPAADVLNGIAYDGETLIVTGKLWPTMYEVSLECVEGCEAAFVPDYYVRPVRR